MTKLDTLLQLTVLVKRGSVVNIFGSGVRGLPWPLIVLSECK